MPSDNVFTHGFVCKTLVVFFKPQIYMAISRTLFRSHTSDNIPLARPGDDSFQVFKIAVKDQN